MNYKKALYKEIEGEFTMLLFDLENYSLYFGSIHNFTLVSEEEILDKAFVSLRKMGSIEKEKDTCNKQEDPETLKVYYKEYVCFAERDRGII